MVRMRRVLVGCMVCIAVSARGAAQANNANWFNFFAADNNAYEAYINLNDQRTDGAGYPLRDVKLTAFSDAFRGYLNQIPFTLLVPNCPITFMEHKRCVVHIARDAAKAMQDFMGRALPIDMDTVIAGAILADVGKLLEYELGPDGKSRQSERGEALRHPFTGVALAMECGVPDAVCHIIAAHAAEGDLVKRTTEAFIVHHADFMAFLPFKNPKNIKLKP